MRSWWIALIAILLPAREAIGFMSGPGNWNIDFATRKQFRLAETQRLEFRGSFYNLLNHANLGNPNATQLHSIFGRIPSASTPRVIELAVRYAF